MFRISSNSTLFFKLFIPSFWVMFFGMFLITLFTSDPDIVPLFHVPAFRWGYTAFYVVFVLFIYFTIFQLKRVELDQQYLYASNYFKTYRYQIQDIKSMSITDLFFIRIGRVELSNKGRFGKKIRFILKRKYLIDFLAKHPENLLHDKITSNLK